MARVLVVDDAKVLRLSQIALLEKLGHEVVGEAVDGQDGCEQYFRLKPDIVMIDLIMPVLDGIAAIEKIKERDKDAKIILLTSNTNEDRINEALSLGVSELLFKPTEEDQLREALNRLLETD